MKKPCAHIQNMHEVAEPKSISPILYGISFFLMLTGLLAISFSAFSTVASVVFLGVTFLASGLAYGFHAFSFYEWKGMIISLLIAIVSIITGIICIVSPLSSAAAITLLIGASFLIFGTIRLIASLLFRFNRWCWQAINGLLSIVLGACIFGGFPNSSLWIIGTLVGIEIFFSGVLYLGYARLISRYKSL